jgi:subtilisin family serine protease
MPDSMNYKLPDLNQTIVSSFQCLDNVITVGNYINRKSYIDYSGNPYIDPGTQGERHITSSIGPTRDGRIKPEICAPGNMTVSAAVLSLIPNFLVSAPSAVAQGGMHMRSGGTSFSSPCVAGVAALYLEKNPSATAMDVKNAILGCTIKDNFTGTALPNNYWGYGKVNAFGALTSCAVIGINENKTTPGFSVYPNPSASGTALTINFSNIELAKKNSIKIYNALGEEVKSIVITNPVLKITTELKPGLYLFNLIVNDRMVSSEKLIIL